MELQRDVSTLDKCIGFYGNLSQVYNYNQKIDYELDAISKYTVFFSFRVRVAYIIYQANNLPSVLFQPI